MKADDVKSMYKHDFPSFIRFAHKVLNPHTPFLENWHLEAIAEALRKVSRGEITRLIINVPPRMGKSLCASVAFPAWILGRDPAKKIICLSGSKKLGQDLHESCVTLMNSKRYRFIFDHLRLKIEPGRILTGHGGHRLTMTTDAKMTGLGGDIVIIDDPIDALRAQDDAERTRINEQFDQNILQRLNNKKTGAIILVMHRVHENDMTGYLLNKGEGWVHLCMPAIALADEKWQLPHSGLYNREQFTPLHAERESAEQLIDILTSIGGYAFSLQYLQGIYKPRFDASGEGPIYISPMREGEFLDALKNEKALRGFIRFKEADFILPRVFGIGADPCPANMRDRMTTEEFNLAYCRPLSEYKNSLPAYPDLDGTE